MKRTNLQGMVFDDPQFVAESGAEGAVVRDEHHSPTKGPQRLREGGEGRGVQMIGHLQVRFRR